MIPAHEDLAQFARAIRHLIRTGAVTYDVAQVHDCVERWGGRQRGVQGFQVGVNVTEQQYAHGSPDKLPIID